MDRWVISYNSFKKLVNDKSLFFSARSIPRKPRKSQISEKFRLSSRIKRSPPIIISFHGIRIYFNISVQISNAPQKFGGRGGNIRV